MVDKEKEIDIQDRYLPYEKGNMEGSKREINIQERYEKGMGSHAI